MGLKTRKQIKTKQKLKRNKKRLKLIEKGKKPEDYDVEHKSQDAHEDVETVPRELLEVLGHDGAHHG